MSRRLLKTCYEEIPEKILKSIEKISKVKRLTRQQKRKLLEEIRKKLDRAKFEPGEAIGIITAQSISEPATQMCLDYNENIIIKKNDRIFRLPIGLFVDRLMDKYGCITMGRIETIDLPENIGLYVLALNSKEKVVWKRIKSCMRLRNSEKLVKIITRSGRNVIASKSHSFITRKNNQLAKVRGTELRIGMRIPVIQFLPHNSLSTVRVKELKANMKLDELLGYFLGAFISKGYANPDHGVINISSSNDESVENVRKFLDKFRFNYKECTRREGFGRSRDLSIYSRPLSKFLSSSFGARFMDRKIPNFVLNANKHFLSSFLKAIFDGDGNVIVKRKIIRISSNSEELIDGIKILLNRFNIFSYKFKSKNQFWLQIPYKYAGIFYDEIGSFIKSKHERLEKLAKLARNLEKKSIEFYDLIPNFGDLLYTVAKKLKYPTRYINSFTKKQKIGRETLKRYIRLFDELSKKKKISVENELKILKQAINSDVIWDEIVKIDEVTPSTQYIYDISVEDCHTFTTFDGIVVHNTMRTFHFAGSAGVQVTLGLPRLIEIFDAKKIPETPSMIIHLKNRYNNKKDARAFAEKIREKKLSGCAVKVVTNFSKLSIKIKLRKNLKKSVVNNILDILRKSFKDLKIRKEKDFITIIAPKETDIKKLYKLKKKIMNLHILGIKDIKNVIIRKEGKNWVINTIGSNLERILMFDEVDVSKTRSNNVHETQAVLGIEAARNLVIKEASETLKQQGLNVDQRHIMLVADIMTFSGRVRAIGRYGVAGAKTSVLSRAAFEETIKHLTKAAVKNEKDRLDGIFENVMIGQVVPSGTGLFELVAKFEEQK